jgi:ABC-type glycerol-3-phosphate transport system substrate-binding protein
MKSFLLRLLLFAGIGVNVAFLLINLSPERPHLAHRHKVRVLVRAGAARAAWMKANIFDEFGAANDLDIEPVTAQSFSEVAAILKAEKEKPTGLLLADINDEISGSLRSAGAIVPMQDHADPAEVAAAIADYQPEAIERAMVDGKLWFVPKRALVDVAAWLRPAVEDLYLNWEKDRPAIEAALREANGIGLPRSYDLEKTPDGWDCFDLFVAGWYWAHHPAPWAGPGDTAPAPRLAWRVGLNDAALDDLIGSFYRHGFEDEDVGKIDHAAVVDALQWRALFRKHHLLARVAEDDRGLDAMAVNALLKERRIAWAPIDQADSLWVHGGSRREAEPGMRGAVDLDWAGIPAGASVELDPKTREPARPGRSFSLEEVHFWTIPARTSEPRLAVRLARFVTQRGPQQRETEAMGLLPVRRDLAEDYPILFRLDWMQRMLDASYRQIAKGSGDMPVAIAADGYDKVYTDLAAAVLEGTPPVTLSGVRARVDKFKASRKAAEASHAR